MYVRRVNKRLRFGDAPAPSASGPSMLVPHGPGFAVRRKRLRFSKIPRPPMTHSFSRYGNSTTYTMAIGNTEADFGQHFTFDQIINYAEFSSLFDRYRIDKVVLKFQLMSNPDANYAPANTAVLNATNYFPKLWYCTDTDDANAITLAQMKERGNCKCVILRPNKVITVAFSPNILSLTYRTALGSGYSPSPGIFVDATNTDVPYYAFKHVIDSTFAAVAANQFVVQLDRQFFFTMRDVR